MTTLFGKTNYFTPMIWFPNSTCRSEHHVILMKMNSLEIYFLCSRQIMSKLHAEVLFWYPGETRANTNTAN